MDITMDITDIIGKAITSFRLKPGRFVDVLDVLVMLILGLKVEAKTRPGND